MRKVLWSGSLKHQGASLTTPLPPSSFSNPRAERPNQGRAACAASFANLPMGRQHRWWCPRRRPACSRACGVVLERAHAMPGLGCHRYPPGGALTGPQQMTSRSLASSAQLRDGVVKCFFFTHMGIFDKWVDSERCQPKRECIG